MRFPSISVFGLTILILIGCKNPGNMKIENIDVQGHRGARGLMPENTIPAFLKAVELGVTTLELDLVVTKDKRLLVSHDHFMSSNIALDSTGNEFPKAEERSHNIYQMTYDLIKKYDVGSRYSDRFPYQKKMKVSKPLLSDVVTTVNEYLEMNDLPPVRYNIELKSSPETDNIFHPAPSEFSDLVYDFIDLNMDKRLLNVQSFDFRTLQYFHENYPDINLAVLIEIDMSIDEDLEKLGFIPDIFSPEHILLDADKVAFLKSKNMKVIPWTVNDPKDIKKVIRWGVDGIISDYPDRVLEIISE